MLFHYSACIKILTLSLLQQVHASSSGYPRINEISDKGTNNACNGKDWIEIYYDGGNSTSFDLSGYILHDDNGPNGSDSFTFSNGTRIKADEYLLLCIRGENASISPKFGIGGDDQISLVGRDGSLISTTGQLSNRGEVDVSFAYDDTSETYVYSSTPTPGGKNIITPLPEPETINDIRERLVAQNRMGVEFFDMDEDGLPVEGGFDEILDFHMKIDPMVRTKMYEEQGYQLYSDFISASVTKMDDESSVLLNMTSPGRLRPKGQSTLYFGVCENKTIPYSIDFDYYDTNQTLFGVQRAYLRTHIGDPSFVREWAQHRMLARFGLPHLRTRKVRYFVNGDYVGLYDLLEAPEQDYVYQRSFPNFDPQYYGLYKIKTLSLRCGAYTDAQISVAEARINETSTPPYSYQRGEHRSKIPVLGANDTSGMNFLDGCGLPFIDNIGSEFEDVVLAYTRATVDDSTTTCGEFLIDEGLFDRDLGVNLDKNFASFYNKHLGSSMCADSKCSNSDLKDEVDITNFLKNFAVMAAVLNGDSPLGNGNNYYLAQASSIDNKFKIVQYDHNNILSDTTDLICDNKCMDHLIHWSIARPTCRALESQQLVGPLLTDKDLHSQYIEYVRKFTQEVMMNQEFLDQLHSHLVAIKTEVRKDSYNEFADHFDLELDTSTDQWLHTLDGNATYVPFLPAVKARSNDIMKQLEAIDKGSVPPRDQVDIKFWEQCVDWRSTDPPVSACYENCFYDGCFQPDFTIPAFCDENTGTCTHSVSDRFCDGVPMFERYDGMEESLIEGSGKYAFCFDVLFVGPVRMAQCPDPDWSNAETLKSSGFVTSYVKEKYLFLATMVVTTVLLFVS